MTSSGARKQLPTALLLAVLLLTFTGGFAAGRLIDGPGSRTGAGEGPDGPAQDDELYAELEAPHPPAVPGQPAPASPR